MSTTTIDPAPQSTATGGRRFYLWMMVFMAVVSFVGFAPTFWVPLAQGVPERIAVIAVHAIFFYGWMFFAVYQAWLAASGNIARHRTSGLFGVGLAIAMVIFGMLAAINSGVRATAAGFAEAGETFMVVPMGALLLFAVFVTAAIVNVQRSEWHKRFMIGATVMILDAAVARLYLVYVLMGGHPPSFQGNVGLAGFGGPPLPPIAVLPPALLTIFILSVGMIFDWRTRGKVHPAYWWVGGIAVSVHVLKIPLSETQAWQSAARWMISLAG